MNSFFFKIPQWPDPRHAAYIQPGKQQAGGQQSRHDSLYFSFPITFHNLSSSLSYLFVKYYMSFRTIIAHHTTSLAHFVNDYFPQQFND